MVQDEDFLIISKRIYLYIANNPGLHLRKISRDLDIHLSTLRYHLDYLEEKEAVVSKKEHNLKVYFPVAVLGSADKEITSLLQQKRFRDIILQILVEPGATHKQVGDALDLKPSTLTKYIKVLKDRGVITSKRSGRQKKYFLKDEKRILKLLLTYKRSFWDDFVDNVLEIYFEG